MILKKIQIGLLFLGCLILINSCTITKLLKTTSTPSEIRKAKRKFRKADKLIKEATILAPELVKVNKIVKMDTMWLNKDSIIFETKFELDTVEVDRIIDKLIIIREEGGDTRGLRQEIYNELLPDMNYKSRDSLKIIVDDKVHYVRFDAHITIIDDKLNVTVIPVDNVPFVSIEQITNIDAAKVKGNFWKGLKWGVGITFLLLIVLWFFRGIISTAIKGILP